MTNDSQALLLIAPVVDDLITRLSAAYTVYRLYDQQEDPDDFLQRVGDRVQVVVTRGDIGVTRAVLDALPRVGLIAIFGVGTDAVDLPYARSRDIAVTITSGVLTQGVADLAMGLLLAGARQLCLGDRFVREGRWLNSTLPLATQVSGKRIGILGMGNIGQAIARRASGFDMQILYHDRNPNPQLDYQWCSSLHALARESDFLVIAASGSAENRRLINANVFEVMPAHAWLINIARGSLIDEAALIQALQNKTIAGAALDVYEDEPNVPAALMALDNVVLQPHVASATRETRQNMSNVVFANVEAYFSRRPLPNQII